MSFDHTEMRAVKKTVHRLGLAPNYGVDAGSIRAAFERGINYVFYAELSHGQIDAPLREAIARDREKLVIAAVPTLAFWGGGAKRGCDKILRELGTDYLDVLQLGWLGVTSVWTEGMIETLVALRESGKVRALGVSIHDRPRAGRLAEDSVLDMLMIRYNAAHPGAEREIFPHLAKRSPSIVAYTATSWRKLLKRPSGWSGPVPTAGDCYRFCLTNPHVDVVLTGPADAKQLDENLAALEKGPMTEDELKWMRDFGRVVHG